MGSPAVVVVDCGAHAVKAGFAGETNPRVVIPTCTATVKGQVTKRVGDQVGLVLEKVARPVRTDDARAMCHRWTKIVRGNVCPAQASSGKIRCGTYTRDAVTYEAALKLRR